MDYCNELIKINNHLFNEDSKVLNLLSNLSNIGVIAGGSIVFALNSFVPKETVGDIDIFVDNKDDNMKCIELIYEKFPKCEFIVREKNPGYNIPYEIRNTLPVYCSVTNIKILENCPPIQLILKEFISPMNLIEEFDIDYVQCAIHNNKLHVTKDCIKSHKERKIFKIKTSIRYDRLLKTTLKGFKCIVFDRDRTSYNNINYTEVTKTIEQIRNLNWSFFNNTQYFDEKQENSPFILTDSTIVKTVEVANIQKCEDVNILPTIYKTFTYLNVETEDGICIVIKIDFFSYNVNIKKFNKEKSIVEIDDDLFLTKNELLINSHFELYQNYFDMYTKDMPLGENTLFIRPYYKNLESQDLSGVIKCIEDLNENILPIYAFFDYEVIGYEFEIKSDHYYSMLNIKSCKK